MNSSQMDMPSTWEDVWDAYDRCHHSPTSSVDAHMSSVFTDSSRCSSSPATEVSTPTPTPTPPVQQLQFTVADKVTDNWTIASGRLAWKRPSWVPKNGRELALKTAFRAFSLSPDDVRHGPVPPLESVCITWRDVGRPGGLHRPIAIVSVTRPAGVCTRQPRTKMIFMDYRKAAGRRIKTVFIKHPSRRIKVEREPTEDRCSRLDHVPSNGQAGTVETLISDENIKTEFE